MATADGRFVLVYNGELYNTDELRQEFEPPTGWRGRSDSEVLLETYARLGCAAFERLRGMFAVAIYDRQERSLVLARDPLSIKPLYWWADARQLVFASEIPALLEHPSVPGRPNLAGISAYLTTLRATLGENTLYENVQTLAGGTWLRARAGESGESGEIEITRGRFWKATAVGSEVDETEVHSSLRAVLADSVERHLQADVPVAMMLSGGLDSAVLAELASGHGVLGHAYTAGAGEGPSEDLELARQLATAKGWAHTEVTFDGTEFWSRWRGLVGDLGVPLSTPNEVAIQAMAERMRADGQVVAISGEGADELLGGYQAFLDVAASYCSGADGHLTPGRFHLEAGAWVPIQAKAELFRSEVWGALEGDGALLEHYDRAFEASASEVGPAADPLDAHQRFLRHVNLPRLLRRLDTATMSRGIEGRMPFSDLEVLRYCESLPIGTKYRRPAPEDGPEPRGKLVLRAAFGSVLSERVLQRPKDSFSLPFTAWLAQGSQVLRESAFARELFEASLLEALADHPERHWKLAWPLLNVGPLGRAAVLTRTRALPWRPWKRRTSRSTVPAARAASRSTHAPVTSCAGGRKEELDSTGKPVLTEEDWSGANRRVSGRLDSASDKFEEGLAREQGRERDLDDLFAKANEKIKKKRQRDDEGL